MRINTQFNLSTLYNKVPFLKNLLATKPSTRNRVPSRDRSSSQNQNNSDKSSNKLVKILAQSIFSLKNFSFSYSESNGTFLPGFMPVSQFFGMNSPLSNSVLPRFCSGSQNDIRIPGK